jgi:hypothetical protein
VLEPRAQQQQQQQRQQVVAAVQLQGRHPALWQQRLVQDPPAALQQQWHLSRALTLQQLL